MAAKKVTKKSPPKKPAPKAVAKPVKKGPPPSKKPVVKKGPPPAAKKLAVKKGPPPQAVKKAKAPKPAAEPVSNYRKLRKYTLPKLAAFLEPDMLGSVRQKIRSTQKGALLASELYKYLNAIEKDMPDWAEKQKPKGTKRGRPPKAAAVAKKAPTALPKALAPKDAKAVIEAARTGKLLVNKAPPPRPTAPVVKKGPPPGAIPAKLSPVKPGGPPRLRLVSSK